MSREASSPFPAEPIAAELTGHSNTHIDFQSLERPVHRAVVPAWEALQTDARAAGFELALASGFRDYSRQFRIWNEKATGVREVVGSDGGVLDCSQMDELALMHAILRWSALPGASRHHWGTDLDVYDRAALPMGAQVELTMAEVADEGPFGPLHRWLDGHIGAGRSHGFFRPYAEDRGGIAPERWHLSYAPLAAGFQAAQQRDRLWLLLDNPALQLRNCVARHWPEVYDRYIAVPPGCYPQPWADLLGGQIN